MYCYVPGCPNGTLASKEGKKARPIVQIFFTAPEDETLFKAWQAAVPKSDHVFTRDDKLCEFHFQKSEVVLYIETKLPNGNVRRLPASEPKLKAGTIPSIFPQVDSISARAAVESESESQPKTVHSEAERPKVKRKSNVLDDSEKTQRLQPSERLRGRPRKNNSGSQSTSSVPEKRRKLARVEPIVKKEKDDPDTCELESSSESEKQISIAETDENGIPSSVQPCTIRLVPLESLLETKPSKLPSIIKSAGGSSSGKQRKRVGNDFDKDVEVSSSKKTKATAKKEYFTPNPYQRVYDSHIGVTPTGRRIKKRLLDISDDPLSKELQLLMKGSQSRGRRAMRKDNDEISTELEKIVNDFSNEREEKRFANYRQEISSGKSIESNSVEDMSNDYSENYTDDMDGEIIDSITIKSDPDEEDQKDSLKELCAALEGSSSELPQSCEFEENSPREKVQTEIMNTVSPRKIQLEGTSSSTWASVCHNIPEDIQKLRDALTSDDEGKDEAVENTEKTLESTVEKSPSQGEKLLEPADTNIKEGKGEEEASNEPVSTTSEKNDGEEISDAPVPAASEKKQAEGVSVATASATSEKKYGEGVSDTTVLTTSEEKDGGCNDAPVPATSEILENDSDRVSDAPVPAPSEEKDEEGVSDAPAPASLETTDGEEVIDLPIPDNSEKKDGERVCVEPVPPTSEKEDEERVSAAVAPSDSEKKHGEQVIDGAVPATSEKKDGERVSDEPISPTSEKQNGERVSDAAAPTTSEKEDGEGVIDAAVPASPEKGEGVENVRNDAERDFEKQKEPEEVDDQDVSLVAGENEGIEEERVADEAAPALEEENENAGDFDLEQRGPIVDLSDDDEVSSDIIEKDVEAPSCNEPRITQVISLSDALSEGEEQNSENIEVNKAIEVDNYSSANEEDNDDVDIAEGRQSPDHEDSGLKSTPDEEVYDISSDSDADPTWQPDEEAVAVSDDNDTDPGSIHDEDDDKGNKEADDSHTTENESSPEKGNTYKEGTLAKTKENKLGEKDDSTENTPFKGKKRRPIQKRGRKKEVTSATSTIVTAAGAQPVNILTSETIQEILKQIKLPLTTPVTLKIAPLVKSPEGKLVIDEKSLTSPTNLRKIAPRTGYTIDSTTKIKIEEYASKVISPKICKTSRAIISNEKCKRTEGLLGLKMFEGLGKIKRAFDFSTFLSDAEDEIQFKKFCYLVKECLNVVQEAKNAKTNIGKLTINITHKSVQNLPEFTESRSSQNSKPINSENDEAEVFECMTVDSNVEYQFGHRSFNEKFKYP